MYGVCRMCFVCLILCGKYQRKQLLEIVLSYGNATSSQCFVCFHNLTYAISVAEMIIIVMYTDLSLIS